MTDCRFHALFAGAAYACVADEVLDGPRSAVQQGEPEATAWVVQDGGALQLLKGI